MLKISYTSCPDPSLAISFQFTVEICVTF